MTNKKRSVQRSRQKQQRTVSISCLTLVRGLERCALLAEQLHHVEVPVARRQVQRRLAEVARHSQGFLPAARHQRRGALQLVVRRRQVQECPLVCVVVRLRLLLLA